MTEHACPPEEWRPTTRHPAYEVSSRGRVRRVGKGPGARPGRVLRPGRTDRGYLKVHLGRSQQVYVHQLVAEAFHGPAPLGQEVDHDDWDREHNCTANLRWETRAINCVRWANRRGGRNVWETPDSKPGDLGGDYPEPEHVEPLSAHELAEAVAPWVST